MFKLILLATLSFSISTSAGSLPTAELGEIKKQINQTELSAKEKKSLTTKVTLIDNAPTCSIAKMLNESLQDEIDGYPDITFASTSLAVKTCDIKIRESIKALVTVKKINDIAIMGSLISEISKIYIAFKDNVASICEITAENNDKRNSDNINEGYDQGVTGNKAAFIASCVLNKINDFAQKLK